MRVASFFSGIGGFDLGLEYAGMQVVFQCEKNQFAQSILRCHWPNVPLHSDINTLQASQIPESELWCAGFPCQDVSLANQGKRQGLNGGRSGLFYRFAELLTQQSNEQRPLPKWVIMENVPGLLNSHKGEDFRTILQRLDELGYIVAWRVLDSKYFGTPQRRRRVFIVASFGTSSAAQVLFGDLGTPIAPRPGQRQEQAFSAQLRKLNTDPNIYSIQHAAVGRAHQAGPQARGYRNDGETWTLDSRGTPDTVSAPLNPFRVRETSRLSTWLDRSRTKALGNAVTVPIVEWLGKRIMQAENPTIPICTCLHSLEALDIPNTGYHSGDCSLAAPISLFPQLILNIEKDKVSSFFN